MSLLSLVSLFSRVSRVSFDSLFSRVSRFSLLISLRGLASLIDGSSVFWGRSDSSFLFLGRTEVGAWLCSCSPGSGVSLWSGDGIRCNEGSFNSARKLYFEPTRSSFFGGVFEGRGLSFTSSSSSSLTKTVLEPFFERLSNIPLEPSWLSASFEPARLSRCSIDSFDAARLSFLLNSPLEVTLPSFLSKSALEPPPLLGYFSCGLIDPARLSDFYTSGFDSFLESDFPTSLLEGLRPKLFSFSCLELLRLSSFSYFPG